MMCDIELEMGRRKFCVCAHQLAWLRYGWFRWHTQQKYSFALCGSSTCDILLSLNSRKTVWYYTPGLGLQTRMQQGVITILFNTWISSNF